MHILFWFIPLCYIILHTYDVLQSNTTPVFVTSAATTYMVPFSEPSLGITIRKKKKNLSTFTIYIVG